MRFASIGLISLALGTLLSCRQATQITVRLRGEGFACSASAGEPGYAGSGVLARAQLTGSGDLAGPRADGGDDDCTGAAPVDLGSVVLVPESGVGPVEVLAMAALTPTSGPAPSIDECMAVYEAFLNDGVSTCAPSDTCAACIFARRSLGFVEYSNLDLTISLDNDCAGVLCEASKTCVPARGCVSAVVTCEGESCDEPGGGEGGGGPLGGAGGAGGDSTGGAPPVASWELLDVPPGATPRDVVARTQQVGGGTALVTYVAAGNEMLRYAVRDLDGQIIGPGTDTFLAVAVEDGGTRVAAVGRQGVALGPEFLPDGVTAGNSVDLDIAFRNGDPEPIVAVDRGPFATCGLGVATFAATSDCGAAVFAVGTGVTREALAVGGNQCFSALDDMGIMIGSGPMPVGSNDWSLWAHPVVSGAGGESSHGYGVPNPSVIRRFFRGGGVLVDDVQAADSAGVPDATIDAIWGVERSGGVDIYAVGVLDGAGWLARAQVNDGISSFQGWKTLGIPSGVQKLTSIWIGPDPGLADAPVVVIAGSTLSSEGLVAIAPLGAL